MRDHDTRIRNHYRASIGIAGLVILVLLLLPSVMNLEMQGQSSPPTPATTEERLQKLTDALAHAEEQIEASQRQILELRKELSQVRQQVATEKGAAVGSDAGLPAEQAASQQTLEELREQQALQQAQIATHEQSKLESASKYPVTVSGLILMNGFVNTHHVDAAATPTEALPGAGSTGLSWKQTVLGLDARGPHLFGAESRADVRVDFFGDGTQSTYNTIGGLLRLRTAHAELEGKHTQVFAELDRSILSPHEPSSLTAVAQPALSWSGNLWSWNPQVGIAHRIDTRGSTYLKMQAALIDSGDPPAIGAAAAGGATLAEQSRWPGSEARLAFAAGKEDSGPEIGFGGYFSPHRTTSGFKFNAWAGTMDLRLPLPKHFEVTGMLYRGQALGGLGGGGYKDYVYYVEENYTTARALEDIGGWAQLKRRVGERLELNAAYGVDNVFASQLRPFAIAPGTSIYWNTARNRTLVGNFIYSPTTYLMFSLEYRYLMTSPVIGATSDSNVIGVAGGYRF
jgi:hypothetical protein